MNHKEMISVIGAHERGEMIQECYIDQDKRWFDSMNPDWNFKACKYRIKTKEPTRYWICNKNSVFKIVESEAGVALFEDSYENATIIPVIELTPEVAEKLGIEL